MNNTTETDIPKRPHDLNVSRVQLSPRLGMTLLE